MTNEQIQEASQLISDIESLEKVTLPKKGERYYLAIENDYSRRIVTTFLETLSPIAEMPHELFKHALRTLIDQKKARLGDLRAGC